MPRLNLKKSGAILDAYRSGVKVESIAARFGCTASYVSKLARRRGMRMRAPRGVKVRRV
jgi:hypothetical protein